MECLVPQCSKEGKRRGLCDSCYSSLARMVRLKRTTWKQLEKEGKVNPKKKTRNTKINKYIDSK